MAGRTGCSGREGCPVPLRGLREEGASCLWSHCPWTVPGGPAGPHLPRAMPTGRLPPAFTRRADRPCSVGPGHPSPRLLPLTLHPVLLEAPEGRGAAWPWGAPRLEGRSDRSVGPASRPGKAPARPGREQVRLAQPSPCARCCPPSRAASQNPVRASPAPHRPRGLLSRAQVSLRAAQGAGRDAFPTAQELQEQGRGQATLRTPGAPWDGRGRRGPEPPARPAHCAAPRSQSPAPRDALPTASCSPFSFWTTGTPSRSGPRKFGSGPVPGSGKTGALCVPPALPPQGLRWPVSWEPLLSGQADFGARPVPVS